MNTKDRIAATLLKTLITLVAAVILAILATSVSLVYDFGKPEPFSGPDIFNPYEKLDTAIRWKRANFHTHTKVEGIFNECDFWPEEVHEAYMKFGYDIVTFSNHNELTDIPPGAQPKVNVYEHGLNLFKYHKLVFGCGKVNRFDNLLPFFAFQRQFQMDLLAKDADFIQLNHPARTNFTSESVMEKLGGYRIIELDSGRTMENEYWDWALSAGHYSFGLANDDLHYPDRSGRIAVRSNFLCSPSNEWEDVRETLLDGCYYSMRIPDYGRGDWEMKYARNRELPSIRNIGLEGNEIHMELSETADSIKVIGQDHTTLALALNSDSVRYMMKDADPYARITAFFPEGEVIYTNPFARYDSSVSETPYKSTHNINIILTILYNILILILCAATVISTSKIICRK